MPIKLLPHLRFLNLPLPVTRFPSMNLKPAFHSSASTPAFRRIFPFKLKYLGFATPVNQQQLGVRKLSTRSFRPRPASRSSSEFSRDRGRGRGGGEVRSSKSLIDDEAELSDWVSELGSDTFRGRRASKDDGESDFMRGGNGGGRDRDSFSTKRRRESDSDEFYESNRKVNRNSVNSFYRNNNSRSNRRSNSDMEDGNGDFYSPKKNRGFERGNVSSFRDKRNERNNRGGGLEMGNVNSFREKTIERRERREAIFSDDDVIEERGRMMSGIGDLLGEEVSDSDEDEEIGDNARSSIGLDKEGAVKIVERSSPGAYESYLSESTYVVERLSI